MNYLQLKVSSDTTHYLFLRRHQAKPGSALPEDRTLFLANIPVDSTERSLGQFFGAHGCGLIETVGFSSQGYAEFEGDEGKIDDTIEDGSEPPLPIPVTPLPPRVPAWHHSGSVAHIVFLDPSSIDKALSLSKSNKLLKWPPDNATPEPTGMARYVAQYHTLHPSLEVARRHADSFMEHFEVEQAKKKRQSKYKKGEAIIDEDGFTLVTRGGAYGKSLGGGVGVAKSTFSKSITGGKLEKKNKQKEKPDFYRFQIREQKRKEFMELRGKFEEDKRKVEVLKKSRRFKPY